MEPFTMISGAMALADATGLTSWIGSKLGGEVGEKTAAAISGIAQDVTGTTSVTEALEIVKKDPSFASKIKMKVLDQEHELVQMALADIKDARAMYKETDHSMADKISDNIMKYNFWYILVLVAVLVGVNFVPAIAGGIISMVSAILGGIITKLLDERSQVTGFFLGSSQSSKDKTNKLLNS